MPKVCHRYGFAVGVGEAGADFPVRRKCPFDFGFAVQSVKR